MADNFDRELLDAKIQHRINAKHGIAIDFWFVVQAMIVGAAAVVALATVAGFAWFVLTTP